MVRRGADGKGQRKQDLASSLPDSVRGVGKHADRKVGRCALPLLYGRACSGGGYAGDRARPAGVERIPGRRADRTAYAFKRHAIQESIYGVDIDPSAVDIAKLRLWLSLVVDEEDYRSIKPLPNLGYKIVCGNSLL